MKKAILQRLYYIKNMRNGFSLFFLLPGFFREKITKNFFFKILVKNNSSIKIKDVEENKILIEAGDFVFIFPDKCFYEGDFFDIVYPSLKLKDVFIESIVYKNPYYESEGCYENFGAIINKNDVVIDAGANIGLFSVVASKKVGEEGKILAFEPMKNIADNLVINLRNNNCHNVKIETLLLGEKNDDVDFYFDLEENYNASSKKIKKDNFKSLKLKQETLDTYIVKNNISKVDFIKADIEGSERDLLAGAENTIKSFRPKISLRTYHLPDDPEVLSNIIKSYVPEYNIKLDKKTLYAWI